MIYQISSGQGPAECELGVAKFLNWLSDNYEVSVIDTSEGYHPGTYRSARIFTESDLSSFVGSVQWICRSSYRPGHKRKNWFIDFSECVASPNAPFDESRVVFQTFRSGGKGGQNVNKVESGVRAINLDTGESVVCTEERSQHANKQKALRRLEQMRQEKNAKLRSDDKKTNWRQHTTIQRGGAILKFSGMEFVRL